jgi:hypothetical protein
MIFIEVHKNQFIRVTLRERTLRPKGLVLRVLRLFASLRGHNQITSMSIETGYNYGPFGIIYLIPASI